ncbi:hypothetical protein [Paenibacillus sp. FSL W7-1287]|uniref:hypothetical protein n=1 Tax=Paenibacillus sp. FSL W7-1287 TaxID=2954538 RepID=UPI0030F5A233
MEQQTSVSKFLSLGQSIFYKSCQVNTMRQFGLIFIHEDFSGDKMLCRGKIKTNGLLDIAEIRLYGRGDLRSINSQSLVLNGIYDINGSITCRSLSVYGGLNVSGRVKADSIAMNLNRNSYIQHLSAPVISVVSKENCGIESVIGDVVNLNGANVERVEANVVSVTGSSVVEVVKYSQELNVSDDSIVKNIYKIENNIK